MKNKIKFLILALIGLLFSTPLVSADLVSVPPLVEGIVGGISLLVGVGSFVGIIAIISYLIIRWIRKKYHSELNKSAEQNKINQNVPK